MASLVVEHRGLEIGDGCLEDARLEVEAAQAQELGIERVAVLVAALAALVQADPVMVAFSFYQTVSVKNSSVTCPVYISCGHLTMAARSYYLPRALRLPTLPASVHQLYVDTHQHALPVQTRQP